METLPRVVVSLMVVCGLLVAGPAAADPPEQIVNGTFDSGHAPWWGTGNLTLDSSSGQLCADVPGGTVNPWDVIIGQDNIALVAGESYQFGFDVSSGAFGKALIQLPVDPWTQFVSLTLPASSGTFTSPVDLPSAQVAFQIGGRAEPWRFCLDNVSLRGGAAPPVYVPDTGPRVRVNQVGYLASGPKNATLVTSATSPVPWELRSASGTVASGQTSPHGIDSTSGQNVHTITFSPYQETGTFTLSADGETSRPFDIGGNFYGQLRDDALKFYYTQRSGVAIEEGLRPGYGRPAGHVGVAPNTGDLLVPCQPGVCDYSLNVRGGWYDAGDHGKYVVNGGISVYQLMSAFERNRWAFSDGQLSIPESGNGVPDILDESRWQMEFLLSMQVPAGKPLAGMAHHKIHDDSWTGLPLLPHLDPKLRQLHPPSTAATLNLAATAAQAARLFAPYDPAFASRALIAARTAWAAALANPAIYASPADGNGGGTYDDTDVTDEFYWAAASLFLTTGDAQFRDYVLASPHHTGDIFRPKGFDWQWVAPLGRLDLATVPNNLPGRSSVRESVVAAASSYLAAQAAHGYGLTYTPAGGVFDWGSNNLVLNNIMVLASAFDITGESRFLAGAQSGMDYLLGRNALNISYITGYGEVNSHNQHSRWYAHQLNPDLPNPPRGTLAGGPNSSIQDPVAQQKLRGCVGQFCYLDDIESWSTNELTINWNSPLAWVASFLAEPLSLSDACRVRYTRHAQWPGGFLAQVTVTNTGSTPIDGWQLRWSFLSGQSAEQEWGASLTQSGAMVTAVNAPWNKRIQPGRSATFGFLGKPGSGPNPAPESFTLNGSPCS
ncbi:MAG TPA: glycosyl hydrolase family 5 [Micromonosporaceae bacterium]|nr:glycosyl hydrolase family 5 [Micromonosporaceae bacterium]HCU51447.1 glycosyl hydrolase family 5 [Micromonosporaceae bacterium]